MLIFACACRKKTLIQNRGFITSKYDKVPERQSSNNSPCHLAFDFFLLISPCRYNRLKFLSMQITIDLKITFTFPSSRNRWNYILYGSLKFSINSKSSNFIENINIYQDFLNLRIAHRAIQYQPQLSRKKYRFGHLNNKLVATKLLN